MLKNSYMKLKSTKIIFWWFFDYFLAKKSHFGDPIDLLKSSLVPCLCYWSLLSIFHRSIWKECSLMRYILRTWLINFSQLVRRVDNITILIERCSFWKRIWLSFKKYPVLCTTLYFVKCTVYTHDSKPCTIKYLVKIWYKLP